MVGRCDLPDGRGRGRYALDDRYAINAAKTEIREGYNTGDAERVLAVYREGYGDLSDGWPSFGRAESKAVLRERLTALFLRYEVELAPVIMDITLFENAALDFGWHEFTLRPRAGGAAIFYRKRYMELWQRRGDGGWGIVLFMDNAHHEPMLVDEMIGAIREGRVDARL